jgi:hypothetical protein
MAEIGMLQDVWNPKIQLCWWHLCKAVRERLSKNKLSTTPYDAARAHREFGFIDVMFAPMGGADASEHEGGIQDATGSKPSGPMSGPNSIPLRIPILSSLHINHPMSVFKDRTNLPSISNEEGQTIPLRLNIKIPGREQTSSSMPTAVQETSGDRNLETKHNFCPPELRDGIIRMMESHLCAHPLIPGYSHPSQAGICEWAVKQMYIYCAENNLWRTGTVVEGGSCGCGRHMQKFHALKDKNRTIMFQREGPSWHPHLLPPKDSSSPHLEAPPCATVTGSKLPCKSNPT